MALIGWSCNIYWSFTDDCIADFSEILACMLAFIAGCHDLLDIGCELPPSITPGDRLSDKHYNLSIIIVAAEKKPYVIII